MKSLRFVFSLIIISILVAACTSSTPPPQQGECPSLPTPDVPPLVDVEAAIDRWENSKLSSYLVEMEERRQDSVWKVRVVVVDDQVRAAQWIDRDSAGNWSDPEAMDLHRAEDYTVDAVLTRLRQDILGEGPAPVDLKVAFNDSLGYPYVVDAEAILHCNEDGEVIIDRGNSYELTMNVETLLEDSFGAGREPVFTFTRSGGREAWCDSLRIYPDGSSIYTDECQQDVLNLRLSAQMTEELDSLRASFGSMDDLRESDDQYKRLTITGTAQGTPDADTLEATWVFAESVIETLSTPIGLGLTLVYVQDGELHGFDVFNQVTQPADLNTVGELYGAVLNQDGQLLAYADESGLSVLMPADGQTESLLDSPEQGYLIPRLWSSTDRLLVANVLEEDENTTQLGWTTMTQQSWHDLPLPAGASGYGCDTGASWSPQGDQLAVGGLEYGLPCNANAGLTVVDIEAGAAERVVDLTIDSGDGAVITAGVHTPAWSPDGDWIAFGLDQDADEAFDFPTRLYLIRPDGSQLTSLTDNLQGTASHPVWSPGGRLYYALSSVSASDDGIYAYDPVSESHTLILAGTDLHPLSFSPDGEFLVYAVDGGLSLWGFAREELIPVTSGAVGGPAVFSGWLQLSE
jgi:WD40 repeat protein